MGLEYLLSIVQEDFKFWMSDTPYWGEEETIQFKPDILVKYRKQADVEA